MVQLEERKEIPTNSAEEMQFAMKRYVTLERDAQLYLILFFLEFHPTVFDNQTKERKGKLTSIKFTNHYPEVFLESVQNEDDLFI